MLNANAAEYTAEQSSLTWIYGDFVKRRNYKIWIFITAAQQLGNDCLVNMLCLWATIKGLFHTRSADNRYRKKCEWEQLYCEFGCIKTQENISARGLKLSPRYILTVTAEPVMSCCCDAPPRPQVTTIFRSSIRLLTPGPERHIRGGIIQWKLTGWYHSASAPLRGRIHTGPTHSNTIPHGGHSETRRMMRNFKCQVSHAFSQPSCCCHVLFFVPGSNNRWRARYYYCDKLCIADVLDSSAKKKKSSFNFYMNFQCTLLHLGSLG